MTVELTAEELNLVSVALGELAIRRAQHGEGADPVLDLIRKLRGWRREGEPADGVTADTPSGRGP